MRTVLLCVNSDVGRGNAIGFRFAVIADELARRQVSFDIIGRANYRADLQVSCPLYKNYLARFLNFLRIYLIPFLNFRSLDIRLFDSFVLRQLKKNSDYKLVHFGEFLPRSLNYLHAKGVKIFLDIPIAHPAYATWLLKKGIKVGVDNDLEEMAENFNLAIKTADVIVAPSEFVKESLVMAGWKDKMFKVIPFGASHPSNFGVEDIQKRAGITKLVYVFAGNVNYRKGIPYLLAAWQKANLPNAELVICGRVYKEISLEIKKYHFDNVVFTGFVKVSDYLRAGQVFVFPSLMEGSAKAVYEAMGYGLPVITTPNAGSVVKDGDTGFVIPIADVDVLADKIRYFYDHRSEITVFGIKAFHVAEEYPWDRYGKSVVNVYDLSK